MSTDPGAGPRPTVVVGYVPSPEGVAALAAAKEMGALKGAHLVVVNTGHHGDYSGGGFATGRDLDAIADELSEAGLSHDVVQPTTGRAATEEIIEVATRSGAELIVIGLRRRSPVGKLLMGSTAQQVLLDAPCAVLAVKPAPAT